MHDSVFSGKPFSNLLLAGCATSPGDLGFENLAEDQNDIALPVDLFPIVMLHLDIVWIFFLKPKITVSHFYLLGLSDLVRMPSSHAQRGQ